jgi:serine/threonine protein kinase
LTPPVSNDRQSPLIRDHETIRRIGRGAYGEVWLARSVTGVMRAVKVVWREDYDYQGAFEREFEAIKRYEPVSRRHPGLVPILQVGRNDEDGFYYYVMELADDVEHGRDVIPEKYRPLTMAGLMNKAGRIDASECVKHGVNIAEALHFMHENGLIHRDVKPSNLIFTDGVCRLADIGLVALLGQRSFVGTEGFVAPEGPGTPQSDIFSLGMVLYEACTGKDRLDFPELPSAKGTGENLDLWKRLNQVICRACAHPAAERFRNAHDMALALRGERVPESHRWLWRSLATGATCMALLGAGAWMWSVKGGHIQEMLHRSKPMLVIKSDPPGAEIYSNGQKLGVTPLSLNPTEGESAIYQLRLKGYRMQEIEHIAHRKSPTTYDLKMEPSKLPQLGERWVNSLGMMFLPRQNGHEAGRPVEMKYFDVFLKATGRPFEGTVVRFQPTGEKESIYIVVVPPVDAEAFRSWLTEEDRAKGFLTNEHHYVVDSLPFGEQKPESEADTKGGNKGWQSFTMRVERQGYGGVMVRTNPPGVKVYLHDELLGVSPVEVPHIKTGDVEFELRGEGLTDLTLDGEVKENEMLDLYADIEARRGVTFRREWKNSLGVKFVPLGDILMASTETRRRDYNEFVKATGARRPTQVPEQPKSGNFPVINITREEARAFCAWLTKRERDLSLIGKTDRYRLPTDEEWSRAVGLPPERGKDPAERSGRIRGVFPWGYEWPPPKGVDNLADESAARMGTTASVIKGYQDRFPALAAVSALPVGAKGFVGLAGNASEWVETDFESSPPAGHAVMGTVRGGNWRSFNPDELLSSARQGLPPDTRRDTIGFRLALMHGAPEDRP